MKTITVYEAVDGSKHPNEKDAIKRDNLITQIRQIERLLPLKPLDRGCNFANGSGYLKCDPTKISQAKLEFTRLANKELEEFGFKAPDFNNINGRILNDYSMPLYSLYYRFGCIDYENRMWGQMYYALHPHEGKEIEFKES